MDEIDSCQCAPGFSSRIQCLQSCMDDSDCPATSVCNTIRCSPPCAPRRCDSEQCPAGSVCINNLCQETCIYPPGTIPPVFPPGFVFPLGFPTGGVQVRKKRSVGSSIKLSCTEGNGQECKNDKNALCQNGVCECKQDTTRIQGLCIRDGTAGGRCDGAGRDKCSKDPKAECRNPGANDCICECKSGTSKINGLCITDGRAGGKCDDNNEKCSKDRNAFCQSPKTGLSLCVCKEGTSLNNGMCISDGTCLGRCIDGDKCPNDPHTVCVDGICQCRDDSSKVSGMCMTNGAPGGRCQDGICDKDINAECINGICQCQPGSSRQQGENCIPDGMPDGNCTNDGFCPSDMMSECIDNNFCRCKSGTQRIGRGCEGTGLHGGNCYFGKCYGRYAQCDPITYTCYCVPGAIPYYGHCIDAGYFYYLQSKTGRRRQNVYKNKKW